MPLTKIKYKIFFIVMVIFVLSSCEKVITINLNNAQANIVVQANVTSAPGPYTVNLAYTSPYYSDNTFQAINGALVNISDNAGNSQQLNMIANGIYATNSFSTLPGRIYNLTITANGKQYAASCPMPNILGIDSFLILPIYKHGGYSGGPQSNTVTPTPSGYKITCKFTDPIGIGNFYRVTLNSNDTSNLSSNTYKIVSDKYLDGTQISVSFRTNLQSLDTVKLQLQCIDQSTYNFFNTLKNAVGSTNVSQFLAALPANPTNNISNKGLGYFAAYSFTSSVKTIP
ncbi:MAG: DUF4249 domain-containing protein [Bacteroidetes bacterium]|nr:DUF4249 domain-containing protein [Bacteroidota bacterium]